MMLVALALAVAALSACSSGGSTARTPDSSASPAATDATGSAVAGPSPGADDWPPLNPNITPTVELSVALAHAAIAWEGPLTPFNATDGSLTISVPKNWHAEQREGQDFLALAYRDDAGLFAGVNIQCSRGATVDELITQDRDRRLRPADRLQGAAAAARPSSPAASTRRSAGPAGSAGCLTDNDSFYFPGDGCTWRLQFGVYHGLRTRDYRSEHRSHREVVQLPRSSCPATLNVN